MTPGRRIAVALRALALAWPSAATAGLITWELEGTIELASPYSVLHSVRQPYADELIPQLDAAGLTPGADWRARVRFDSDTPNVCEDCESQAHFIGATKSLEFIAGSFAATSPAGVVGDGYTLSYIEGSDLYFLSPVETDSTTLFANSAAVILTGADGTLFGASLPTDPPDPTALPGPTQHPSGHFYGTRFNLVGYGFVRSSDVEGSPLVSQSFAIDGRITSITRVPEPSLAALLLAAAGIGFALRRGF